MKRLLLPLLAALALPTAVSAEKIDPEIVKTCMKAADFKGCVEIMSGGLKTNSKKQELLDEIKKLPSRINNTSLRDMSLNTQSFRDALALSTPEEVGEELYRNAKKLDLALNILYETADRKINADARSGTWSGKRNYETGQRLNTIFEGLTIDMRCQSFWRNLGEDIFFKVRDLINYVAEEMVDSGGTYSISQEKYLIESTLENYCKGDPRLPVKEDKKSSDSPKPVEVNCDSAVWKNKPKCNK